MKLNILLLVLTSLVLSACGRAPEIDRSRAVGVDTPLGQSLTKNKWCTPASTDGVNLPKFTTLELRQTGKFFRSTYTLNDDRSLSLEGRESGTWALILDKLFSRFDNRRHQVEAKVSVVEDTSAAGVVSAKLSTSRSSAMTDTCIQLATFGTETETLCPCDFVNN